MKCPVDGDILSSEKAEAHTGYGCASCKGSWLPKNYIESIQYTKEFNPHKFFSKLKNSEHGATNFKCPVNCGVLSSVSEFNGICYCPSCLGIWFESKALKRMLKNYQSKDETSSIFDIPNTSIGVFDLLGALFK